MKQTLTCPKCGSAGLAVISKHPLYLTIEERTHDDPSSMMVVIRCDKCRHTFAESLSERQTSNA